MALLIALVAWTASSPTEAIEPAPYWAFFPANALRGSWPGPTASSASLAAAAPSVVGKGRAGMASCASCHGLSGTGAPQTSSLTGLSAPYIQAQLAAFRRGDRANPVAGGKLGAVEDMVAVAKTMRPDEDVEAAAYFSRLAPSPMTRLVESADAPGAGGEPLGRRIVELPQDGAVSLAYAPVGSIARGKALVAAGGCVGCHGADLEGLDDIPALAGRSPLYLVRQLWGFKTGARGGADAAPMTAWAAAFTPDDMVAVAAYIASLPP